MEAAGVDRTILCSDLGQVGVFPPLEGFRRGVRLCMDLGYDDADIHRMVSTNAARAFGLEADVERVGGS
jgi:adenine deaminase